MIFKKRLLLWQKKEQADTSHNEVSACFYAVQASVALRLVLVQRSVYSLYAFAAKPLI